MMNLPRFNPLTLAIRLALYGRHHPSVRNMLERNGVQVAD